MSRNKEDALGILFDKNGFTGNEISEISQSFSEIIPIRIRFYEERSVYRTHNQMSAHKDRMGDYEQVPGITGDGIPVPYFETGTLLALLSFSLGFAVGGIAEGFFRAIGSDLYQKAKNRVIGIIKGKNRTQIVFKMNYNGTEIHIDTYAKDEVTLNSVFDTINKARDLAVNTLRKEDTPELDRIILSYHDGWKIMEGSNFKPPKTNKLYLYDIESEKWRLQRDLGDR